MARRIEKPFQIKPDSTTVGRLLQSPDTFFVPDYQRDYSWTSEETRELWEDIEALLSKKRKAHYLGAIVVILGNNRRLEIVDGQQRLASMSLLIIAIRKFLHSKGEKKTAGLFANFVDKIDSETGESEPKLVLNQNNRDVYNLVHSGRDPKTAPAHRLKTNKLLVQAFAYFQTQVQAYFANKSAVGLGTRELELVISEMLHVTLISVNDADSAFLIFETLNQRGLELSVSDLIKNHMLSSVKTKDNREKIRRQWDVLSQNVGEGDITAFLRHYWLSNYGVIREREIFTAVRNICKTPTATIGFSRDLIEMSAVYGAIQSGRGDTWVGLSDERKAALLNDLEQINLCGLKQCYPILMAAIQTVPKLAPEIFHLMLVFTFRYSVIGGQATGNLEKRYSDVAINIRKHKPKKIKEVADWFGKMMPTDAQFIEWFSSKTEKNGKIARYILQCLEDQGFKSNEFHTNMSPQKVNLEHVLPQNPSNKSQWAKDFPADQQEEYSTRLGNLTLLETKLNSSIENDDFAAKAKALSKSKFKSAKKISTATSWIPDSIEKRQKAMARAAAKIWSY